jgi:hypothetical protein
LILSSRTMIDCCWWGRKDLDMMIQQFSARSWRFLIKDGPGPYPKLDPNLPSVSAVSCRAWADFVKMILLVAQAPFLFTEHLQRRAYISKCARPLPPPIFLSYLCWHDS